jgi:hypothetical protein
MGGNRDGALSPIAAALGWQSQVTLRGWRLTSRILLRDYSILFDCSAASQVGVWGEGGAAVHCFRLRRGWSG